MDTLTRDLRHAWRSLRQRKAYVCTCAATLALVLGANAAIFAVVSATMIRPLPFTTEGAVVHLFAQPPGTTGVLQRNPLQQMEVPRLRERARTLAQLDGFFLAERVVTRGAEPAVAKGATVTPGLLEMVRAPIAIGRAFLPTEGGPGQFVAIVTDRYWHDVLGGAAVLGSALVLDGQPHTIVGVLAPSFAVPFLDADVLTPLVLDPAPVREPARTVVALATLAPGVSLDQARAELAEVSSQLAQESPRTHAYWTLGAETAREWQFGAMRAPLFALLAATGLVLLIACANIANLTAAHAAARAGELSLRLALGASRRDLARMYLLELLLVGAAGLVPGLFLARMGVPALLAIHPTIGRTLGDVTIDWRVQAFGVLLAVASAVGAALLPIVRARRGEAAGVLKESGRTLVPAHAARVQRALVSTEVALAVALLMAGAVVIQGLRELSARGPGYDAAGVLTAQVRLPAAAYPTPAARAAVIARLLDEVRTLPGVVAAGLTQNAFVPSFSYQTLLRITDAPRPDGQPHTVEYRRASPDYFRAMHIRTLAGRVFADTDTADRPPVAVISKRFADTLMPGLDPIGREIVRATPPSVTIVGVVDDVADVTAAAAGGATFYVAWAQNNAANVPVALTIRTAVEPASLIAAVRAAVKRIDPSLPLRKTQPLEVFVTESTAPERFRVSVLGVLAGLGLVLAALGIAGVTYRSVVDRRRDFAVRLALGASPARVLQLVLASALRDVAIGVAVGIVAGLFACTALARALPNVVAPTPGTTVAAVAILVVGSIVAAVVPALRVMDVHPGAVLRS